MRFFVASLVAAGLGLIQLCVIWFIESQYTQEKSGLLGDEIAFIIFGILIFAEAMCVIALSMYRITPWLLHLMRDDWEANRIKTGRKTRGPILHYVALGAFILRRLVTMVDNQSYSAELLLTLGIALLPFFVPKPKTARRADAPT